jgi:hypothetical protein
MKHFEWCQSSRNFNFRKDIVGKITFGKMPKFQNLNFRRETVSNVFARSRNTTLSFFLLRLACFCLRCNRNPFFEQPGASIKPRCRGLSGTPLVTLLASIFVYNLSITLDIVSGLHLLTSSRSVVPFGSNIDLLSFIWLDTFHVYIIDVGTEHSERCQG